MKFLLLSLGFLSLGFGVLGIFLPVLPTTPFILLAAFFFGRSSARIHLYLLNHKVFGPTIKDFNEKKVLKRKTKIIALLTMWAVLISSVMFFIHNWWATVIVLLIGAGVTIYLIRFPEK